jgi:N-acetylneuraminic acid mutarotase
VVEIDPATGEAKIIAHLPSEREFLGAAAVGGKLYAIGGEDSNWNLLDEIVMIDPSSGEAKVIGHLLSGRARFAVVEVDERIYMIGGWSDGKLDEIVEIDPSTGAMRVMGHLPSGRADLAAVEVKGKIYAIGGCVGRDFLDQITITEIDLVAGSARDLPHPSFFGW